MRKVIYRFGLCGVLVLAMLLAVGSFAGDPRPAAGSPAPAADASATATPEPAATMEVAATPEATPEPAATPEATATPATGRSIDPDRPMIALSFDDGPGPGTRRILRALAQVDGRATFCMVGDRVDAYAETARMVADRGHEIATHTLSHPNLSKLSADGVRDELERSVAVIERVTGVRPGVLRPPYGSTNEIVREVSRDLGLVIANWNIDSEDWRSRDADAILRSVMKDARDGAIVLCHDLYAETAAAMERAVVELTEAGYQLVTVSELLEARADGGNPGQIYYAA